MQRRALGNTAVEVSALALRTGKDTELMRAAFDRGITFFEADDSPALCEFVRTVPRDRIQIAASFGDHFSPGAMRRDLEGSLKQLGTEYIDVCLARHIRLPQFREDLFAELEKAKREGKVRTWGVSLGPEIGWREEGVAAMLEHGAKVVRTAFSIFEQDPGREFCQAARSVRAGVLAAPDESAATTAKLEKLRPYADAHGLTAEQLTTRWLLMDPAVASVMLSAGSAAEIDATVAAANAPPLSLDEMRRLADDYANDWGLGPAAHPRDLGSSTSPTGKVRSGYVPPPVLLA